MIVLDASVIMKWFQEEPDSDRALSFETQHVSGVEIIAAPDLLFYEITNVLRFKKNVDLAMARSALELLAKTGIHFFAFSLQEMTEIFEFARNFNITVYDASYAILAKRLGRNFITADRKLYEKLKKFSWVVLL